MSIDRILRWFPAAWRARYEIEVRDLLDAHPFGWRERVDLMRACADAWLREGASRGKALARGASHVGVRIALLVAIGYVGVSGADALTPLLIAAVGPLPSWLTLSAAFLRILIIGYAGIFVLRPYLEDPSDRPGVLEAVAYPAVFALTVALDGHPAHQGGVLWFGLLATMRFPWFHIGTARPWPPAPRSILGLR
jgi:hypothetical protein